MLSANELAEIASRSDERVNTVMASNDRRALLSHVSAITAQLEAALARAEAVESELRSEMSQFMAIMRKLLPLAPVTDADIAWAQGKIAEIQARNAAQLDAKGGS